MTATYEVIATATLVSNAQPITFTSIPQTYTDMKVIIQGGITDNGFNIGVRVGNNTLDSGSNYSWTFMEGGGSSIYGSKGTNVSHGVLMNGTSSNNRTNVISIDFMNYSNTTTLKPYISRAGLSSIFNCQLVGTWRSTSAINTISFAQVNNANFWQYGGGLLSSTIITLYGIKAE